MDTASKLWQAFNDGELSARNDLVLHYTFLVDRIARKISTTMPIDFEDLKTEGIFGLIDAIEKYNPDRGVRFESYAVTRIRGAIIDSVRGADWVPRSVRSKNTRINNSETHLTHRLRRTPNLGEIAEHAGLSMSEVSRALNDSMSLTHLHTQTVESGETESRRMPSTDDSHDFELDDLRMTLTSSLATFDERERTLFALYYYEGLTLSEIGVVLGVTEARVCQIHTKAMRMLCEQVSPR